MTHVEHAEQRETDRQLRAHIDPLVGALSPQGKVELAMRLVFEGMRELATTQRQERARAELPARHTGSSTLEGDAAGRSSNT